MNDSEFWKIIQSTQADSHDAQLQNLRTALSKLSEEELIAFDAAYRAQIRRAYSWDLWAGAFILLGGCSDDGFDYFRDWLIAQGEAAFEASLDDPEALIDIPIQEDAEFEAFRYVMGAVFEERFGRALPIGSDPEPLEPEGDPWDEDELPQKLPKLWAWAEAQGFG